MLTKPYIRFLTNIKRPRLPAAGGRLWSRLLDALENSLLASGAVLFAAMAVIAFLAVVLRYVLRSPFGWEIEILSFLLAWGVFLGASSVTRRNSHIRISFFAEKIFGPRRAEYIGKTLENVAGVAVCGFLAYLGARWVLFTFRAGATSIGDISYPLWIPRLAVLIGMSLVALFYFERLIKQISSQPASHEEADEENT